MRVLNRMFTFRKLDNLACLIATDKPKRGGFRRFRPVRATAALRHGKHPTKVGNSRHICIETSVWSFPHGSSGHDDWSSGSIATRRLNALIPYRRFQGVNDLKGKQKLTNSVTARRHGPKSMQCV
jgi:hypothetical protein